MRFLVLGSTGMAGHTITLYLKEQGYDVTGLSRRSFPYCDNIIADVTNMEQMEKILLNGYDVVINCIGLLNHECDVNPDRAVYLNSFLPHFCVGILKKTKTKFIHISTDCVFSGKKGQYQEYDYKGVGK